jgi:hypothetical protein
MVQKKKKEKEKEKEKKEGKGKGKGWLFLYYKACHCLLCYNTVATKAASRCFDRPCIANAVKDGAHEQ